MHRREYGCSSEDVCTLPIDVLAHVQLFMDFKDAARSATLCTGLYNTWYSSRSVRMDESTFRDSSAFWNGATKTILRYITAGLTMVNFSIKCSSCADYNDYARVVIEGAAKLGVRSMSISLTTSATPFALPAGVFESECIVALSVWGGALKLTEGVSEPCHSLRYMAIMPDRHIFCRVDLVNNYLMRLPRLLTLICPGFMLKFDCSKLGNRIHSLRSLTVHGLSIHQHIYFHTLLRSLVCLQSLFLFNLYDCQSLPIHNPSIELVSIRDRYRRITATLNVPNLRMFRYDGVTDAYFSFKTTHSGCPSHVTLCCGQVDANWFSCLHRLLESLSSFKLHVSITVSVGNPVFVCDVSFNKSPVQVERLSVHTNSPNETIIDGLLRVCTPRVLCYNHDIINHPS